MSIYKNSGLTQKTVSWCTDIKTFIVSSISFIIWFFVMLPLTIIGFISKKFFTAQKEPLGKVAKIYTEDDVKVKFNNREDRKYDVVIYGTTGYTGFLAARHLASKYGDQKSVKWAIGGRSKERLEKKKAELAKMYPETFTDCGVVVADSKNWNQLVGMCNNTKVICSTVGPFTKYGSELVNACCVMGTDYCDITGELSWNRDCHDSYSKMALKSGARIVSFCGNDCVPWDLVAYKLNQKFQKDHNEKMVKVSCYTDIVSHASGGTIETMFIINEERFFGAKGKKEIKKQQKKDTEYFMAPGSDSGNGFEVKDKTVPIFKIIWDKEAKVWKQNFIMAEMNRAVIDRSNCLLGYSDKLEYHEGQIIGSWMSGKAYNSFMLWLVSGFMNNFVRRIYYAFGVLPKPGEGQTEEQLWKGYLNVLAEGTGEKGTKANCVLTFPVDPGYMDTARMLIECGICFVLNNDQCQKNGGFWTPASCFGDACLDRLVKTGSTFKFYNPRE